MDKDIGSGSNLPYSVCVGVIAVLWRTISFTGMEMNNCCTSVSASNCIGGYF
jgi:hypothetical protein